MKLGILLIAGALAVPPGCAALRTGGQAQSGRQALIAGNPEHALAHFQQVAHANPEYVHQSGLFRQSIWTYLGRTQYKTGMLNEAAQSFQQALSVEPDDYLAMTQLGLVQARTGDRETGLRNIQRGMHGVHDFLEYMERGWPHQAFWDPRREIRSELEKNLDMIAGKSVDWEYLLSTAEWLAPRMESEMEAVRRDHRRFYDHRDRDRRRAGMSLGVGVGF